MRRRPFAHLASIVVVGVLGFIEPAPATPQKIGAPETAEVRSGPVTLHALIWRPSGRGPFPAVLFNHGSYSSDDPMPMNEPAMLGATFARRGYVFLFLFRQGVGLSRGQGVADGDQMARALTADGQVGRNRVQLQLLQNEQMKEAFAALALLRSRPDVDVHRIVIAGHSFGGSLSLLMAAQDAELRAALIFAGAAASWDQSPALRATLGDAVRQTSAPIFFIHAANDYSTASGEALAAEMRRLGHAHRLKIYPAVGRSTRDGHNLLYRSPQTWERDVFAFLDSHLNR